MNIRPSDIDTSKHFFNAFGKTETEISAMWIVQFCQNRGAGWEPFSRAEIESFYAQKHKDGFTFNGLIPKYIIEDARRQEYYITSTFVERLPCFL